MGHKTRVVLGYVAAFFGAMGLLSGCLSALSFNLGGGDYMYYMYVALGAAAAAVLLGLAVTMDEFKDWMDR